MSKKKIVPFSDFIWAYFKTDRLLDRVNKSFMDDFGNEVCPWSHNNFFWQRFNYLSFDRQEIIP